MDRYQSGRNQFLELIVSGRNKELIDIISSSEINFDAYLGTNASTRVGETNLASLKETSGFSVFARHTHANGAIDVQGYLNLADERDNVFWGWSVVKEKSKRVIYTWTPPDTEDGGDLKLTASQLDHTCAKIENDPNSSLYVIPQEKKEAFYLQITYTVQQGTSQNTVKVKKNLLDVNNPFNFEKRKTYLLHLKLSLGSTRSRSSASEDCSVTMSVSSIPE